MRTFLVRHGEYREVDGVVRDGSLTERGRAQAEEAATILESMHLGRVAIFSSHSHRTTQTADIILRKFGVAEVCFNSELDQDSNDFTVLENLTDSLLKELCQGRAADVDAIIAVSHQPTIFKALSNTARPVQRNLVVPGSVHEYTAYRN